MSGSEQSKRGRYLMSRMLLIDWDEQSYWLLLWEWKAGMALKTANWVCIGSHTRLGDGGEMKV